MISKTNRPFSCRPRIRIMAKNQIALGPGKVDLLEAIDRTGSISKAARDLNLSYRRAWDMVDTMNRCFKSPLVLSRTGGRHGGGASLTPAGKRMANLYRSMESKALAATEKQWKTMLRSLQAPQPSD